MLVGSVRWGRFLSPRLYPGVHVYMYVCISDAMRYPVTALTEVV